MFKKLANRQHASKSPRELSGVYPKAQKKCGISPHEWREWLAKVKSFCGSLARCPKRCIKKASFKQVSNSECSGIVTNPLDAMFEVDKKCDSRPHLKIEAYGHSLVALVDSGASISVIGENGLYLIEFFNLHVYESGTEGVNTAEGRMQKITGYVQLPISVDGTCKVMKFWVVPTIRHFVILGNDFCEKFGTVIDWNQKTIVVNDKREGCEVGETTNEAVMTVNKIICRGELNSDQEQNLREVIGKFKSLSWEAGTKLGRTNKIIHKIDTGEAEPIKQRYNNMSPYMLQHLNGELDKMLELGVVQPSSSPWASPVVLIKKSSGEYRFCFDGRKLNSVTKRDAYPLPHIDSILSKLTGAQFLSSIDLKAAFWQIPLDANSKEKTAFVIPSRGLYEFNVLPFGLNNAAQTQQRLMDTIFGPSLEPFVFVYLDDLLIATPTFEKHVEVLQQVYGKLHDANLTINFNKCEFCRASLRYLGFVIDRQGLRTDPEKVRAMVEYPRPNTRTEVKRFLGVAGWYRRFVPNFAVMSAPITQLIKGQKKGQAITWTTEAEESFVKIKEALVSAPVLASPDFTKLFSIQCDASDRGLGCVLVQANEEGKETPVAYASRTLTDQERKYTVTEKECLGVLFGVEKFRPYVEGTKFKIITDHYSLLWLNQLKNPTGRLARWAMKLQQYDCEIEHRKGTLNVVPDALSRAPHEVAILTMVKGESMKDPEYRRRFERVSKFPDGNAVWKIQDDSHLFRRLKSQNGSPEWKLYVAETYRTEVMKSCHDEPIAAHLGMFKTLKRVQELYYWPRMRKDVQRYVRSCEVCKAQKPLNLAPPGLMGKSRKVSYPWQMIALDLIGPLPRSSKGNRFLLVVSDWFTKFCLLKPLRQATSSSITTYLRENVFYIFGAPQVIVCDNGKQLTSNMFRGLAKEFGSQLWFNCKYHPQVNPVERVNKVVGAAIRSYIKDKRHDKWDSNIHEIGYALRTAVHESTGYTPVFLNFGRFVPVHGLLYGKDENLHQFDLQPTFRDIYAESMDRLLPLYNEVKRKLDKAYHRNCHYYNLRRREAPLYAVGDTVWKKNYVLSDASKRYAAKLEPKFVKCKIAEVLSPLVYRLTTENGVDLGRYHTKDLKPDQTRNSD